MSRRNIAGDAPFEEEYSYSRAVVVDDWIILAGTTGYKNYRTGEISPDVAEQAEQALRTIEKVLKEADSAMDDVVRVRYILPDGGEFHKLKHVLKKWFEHIKPAATMEQSGLLKREMKIEIEVMAKRGSGRKYKGHQ